MDEGSRILAGRYAVGELIGRGGMAEVHIGHDTRLGRTVAIKVLRSDLARDPSFLARFRREAQAAASLNHPAIVAVYDTGEDLVTEASGVVAHVPFIVMEYVEGHTVRDILRDGNAVPIDEAVEITAGVLSALEYSHHAGIVHRDIKPANVMLTPTGAIKVMDFGIARAVADSAATMTQTQAVIGTAQYLSPEQARGEQVDARSDLYSTGCLLFELLTGRPPFIGDSPVAVAYQHVREAAPTPSSFAADVPETLDRITLKALAKDRDDRYSSAAEFRADLESAARGGRVAAPPISAFAVGAAASGPATQVMSPTAAATASTQIVPAGASPWAPTTPGATGVLPQSHRTEDEEPPRRRWLLWTLVAVAILAIGGIFALIQANANKVQTPTTVTVPTVANLSEAEARSKIVALGLEFDRLAESNATIAEGFAIRTDPVEGTAVPEKSHVKVWISTGPDSVQLGDLAGLTQDQARAQLKDLGLTVGNITPVDDPVQPQGKVISSDPPAGSPVAAGSAVNLSISSGNVQLPDLVGKSRTEAQGILTTLHLTGSFTNVESADKAPDSVLSQDRPPGLIQQGSTVGISVAIAPTTVTIPDGLVGKTYDEAAAQLQALGLQASRNDVASADYAAGIVTSSNPNKGAIVAPGSTVILNVSQGATPTSGATAPVPGGKPTP
ncbi:Stk1 family PASTA domain-containing Ser/Thr kinase [Cellulomonas sp. WB94]|uniref:Stk1 family PASTA domain-containing Ser/Thr kinase n=1 Tax=Cellulomonas sp. WB94 TaxID=2173174 RepID=UPI003221BCD8